MPYQQALFPIEIVKEEQYSRTLHLKVVGETISGDQYAIKTTQDAPLLPLTEWFCYELCGRVGIPTPGFSVVKRPNGDLALGSRIDRDTVLVGEWDVDPMKIYMLLKEIGSELSAIYALDWFLPNPDRHANNILCRTMPDGRKVPLAFDWSLVPSLSADPVFSRWPWSPTCNSSHMVHVIKALGGWDSRREAESLSRIDVVAPEVIRAILEGTPPVWAPSPQFIDAIVQWWNDNASPRAQGAVP
ncbi:hypothetical protein [Acidithiobacillus sp.]|uniref:hypothetical protein n=1 Tax=Acidithiobacillus sp. TaxID=1872118 RepID=UPI0026263C9B|nr:hypothetical protein [Acidithiobacillus sp.]MDD2749816.1 hypothetical protein [Acidithiobacillus sp.]MDD5280668.1 hypothetical protein [Acidithiobacillus sp.]